MMAWAQFVRDALPAAQVAANVVLYSLGSGIHQRPDVSLHYQGLHWSLGWSHSWYRPLCYLLLQVEGALNSLGFLLANSQYSTRHINAP